MLKSKVQVLRGSRSKSRPAKANPQSPPPVYLKSTSLTLQRISTDEGAGRPSIVRVDLPPLVVPVPSFAGKRLAIRSKYCPFFDSLAFTAILSPGETSVGASRNIGEVAGE